MNWLPCSLLLATITLRADDPAKVPPVAFHEFSARIVSIEPERFRSGGNGVVVDADPRWALKLEITKIASGHPKFAVGDTVVFGIHSPVRLFLKPGPEMVGKNRGFKLNEGGLSPHLSADRW